MLAVIAEVGEGVMELPVVWPVTLVQSVDGVVEAAIDLISSEFRSYLCLQGIGLFADRESYRISEGDCSG